MKKALFLVGVLLPASASGLLLGDKRSRVRAKILRAARKKFDERLSRQILDESDNNPTLKPRDIWGEDTPTAVSGACNGADTLWAKAAHRHGDRVLHLMASSSIKPVQALKEYQGRFISNIPNHIIDHRRVSAALDEVALKRNEKKKVAGWTLSARRATYRNWFQTRRAQSVYVIGYRAPNGGPKLDIGGGTGWAAHFYASRFNEKKSDYSDVGSEETKNMKLYFYDDSPPTRPDIAKFVEETHGKWSMWKPSDNGDWVNEGEWQPLAEGVLPPRPSGVYAAIGGTHVSPSGRKAITALFAQGHDKSDDDEDERR
jgi:hypothetical protein